MDLPIPRGSEILAGYAYFVAQQADSGATQGWSAAHEFGTRKSFLYFTVLGRILAQVADGSADGDGKASLEALSTPLFKEGRRKWKIGSLFSSGFGEFPQRMALSLSLSCACSSGAPLLDLRTSPPRPRSVDQGALPVSQSSQPIDSAALHVPFAFCSPLACQSICVSWCSSFLLGTGYSGGWSDNMFSMVTSVLAARLLGGCRGHPPTRTARATLALSGA